MTNSLPSIILLLLFSSVSVFGQSPNHKKFETEHYEIIFPNQYEKSSQTLSSSLGPLQMNIISYEPNSQLQDSNFVYMIMETDYPDTVIHSDKTEIIDDFFKATINGAVNSVNGKLIKETKGFTAKYPNRTIEIDYQNGYAVIKMSMILQKNKIIIIQTITDSNNYPNMSELNFVNSFKIK